MTIAPKRKKNYVTQNQKRFIRGLINSLASLWLLGLACFPLHASTLNDHSGFSLNYSEGLSQAFTIAYSHMKGLYNPGQCGRNVKELSLYLLQENIPLRNAEVIFILHEKRRVAGGPLLPGPLMPGPNRSFQKVWDFHVVLKMEDPSSGEPLILDLDSKAHPQPLRLYFVEMFPLHQDLDRYSKIEVRVLALETYLLAFDEFHLKSDPKKPIDENSVVAAFRQSFLPDGSLNQPTETLQNYMDRSLNLGLSKTQY